MLVQIHSARFGIESPVAVVLAVPEMADCPVLEPCFVVVAVGASVAGSTGYDDRPARCSCPGNHPGYCSCRGSRRAGCSYLDKDRVPLVR